MIDVQLHSEKRNLLHSMFFLSQLSLMPRGGRSINHSLFARVFKDFPTAAYLTKLLKRLTT